MLHTRGNPIRARPASDGHHGAVSVDESRSGDPSGAVDGKPGLTLDELEQASGVPGRTIRFYRQTGLIDSPRRSGRQAFYSEDQVARLRLIAALRARGLGLDAVSKILADPTGEHRSLSRLLQIRDELLEPWIDDHSAVMTETEILGVLGTDRTNVIDELVHYGVLEPGPDSRQIEVPSVATLDLTGQLMAAGASPQVVQAAWSLMQTRIADLADELVAVFAEHEHYGFPDAETDEEVATAVARLRPIAMRAVQVAFAHEIERAIEELYVDDEPSAGTVIELDPSPRP
jgi:DNA-binding transcriptional MerR regulator